MQKKDRITLGCRAEDLARGHLLQEKYDILQQNFRCPLGELDFICRKDNYYVIIEVKSKRGHYFGSPAMMVTKAKQRTIRKVTQYFLKQKGISLDSNIRFDVIAIIFANETDIEFEHIIAAF
ncbi:YraN family protein [Candidatus Riflebacteria bacterium]